MHTILVTDIGGTHSRFALFRLTPSSAKNRMPVELLFEQWFASLDFSGFPELLKHALHFLQEHCPALWENGKQIKLMVIAAAGPLVEGSCFVPNLSWTISPQDVHEHLGATPVLLLNDFAAQGYACLFPDAVAGSVVRQGNAVPDAPVAVVGAGTGFGQALILPGHPPRILASEGGHNEFPFVGKEEEAFATFMRGRLGTDNIIGDMVVSGNGLAALFSYHSGRQASPAEATARIQECPEALAWFARFYGRLCRHYVLGTLAQGGLYITGGMALRVPVLRHPAFEASFTTSAAHHSILHALPVWHIETPQAGLFGAAIYGALHLQQLAAHNTPGTALAPHAV